MLKIGNSFYDKERVTIAQALGNEEVTMGNECKHEVKIALETHFAERDCPEDSCTWLFAASY